MLYSQSCSVSKRNFSLTFWWLKLLFCSETANDFFILLYPSRIQIVDTWGRTIQKGMRSCFRMTLPYNIFDIVNKILSLWHIII